MKKLLLFFLCFAQLGIAQQVKVLSLEKLKETEKGGFFYPSISPNSDYLLMTKANYQGLVQMNLNDKSIKTLNNDPGAGYGVQISDDCTSVLYKKVNLVQNRRHNSLITQNLQSGEKKVLVNPTREAITGEFINSQPAYVQGKQMMKAPTQSKTTQRLITIENRKMVLYTNGNRKEILPNGKDASYFWSSISPDGKRIVYTVAGKGSFVCGIDGRNVKSLGKLSAPKWAGNNFLVGMDDIDDGEKLISSTVLIVSADGKTKKRLETPQGVNAMYPTASKNGSKIAFNTEKGEIYIANVELK